MTRTKSKKETLHRYPVPSVSPCPPLHVFIHTYSETLFSGSNDLTVKVWNLDTFKIDVSFQAHDDPVCTLSASDTYLLSGSLKSIKVYH